MNKQLRKAIIAGNWKMNKTPAEAKELLNAVAPLVKDADCEVIACVPFVDLQTALEVTEGTNKVSDYWTQLSFVLVENTTTAAKDVYNRASLVVSRDDGKQGVSHVEGVKTTFYVTAATSGTAYNKVTKQATGVAGAAGSDALGETGKGFAQYIMVVGLCETVALFAMVFSMIVC